MVIRKAILALVLVTAVPSTARAHDGPGDEFPSFFGPKAYTTSACWDPQCTFPATSPSWPNEDPFITVATLQLPPGRYLVFGKLSAWPDLPGWPRPTSHWGDLDCFVGVGGGAGDDYAAAEVGSQKTMAMTATVHLTAPGTVKLGCHVWGAWLTDWGEQIPATMHVWGVRLTAVRLGMLVEQ